jgi:BON domain
VSLTNALRRSPHPFKGNDLIVRACLKKLPASCLVAAVCWFGALQLPAQKIGDDPNAPQTKTKVHQASTKDVQEKLEKGLDSKNPAYSGSSIQTAVDDQTITLSGTVTSQQQREMARQLAQAYAGNRRIVDRLVISR